MAIEDVLDYSTDPDLCLDYYTELEEHFVNEHKIKKRDAYLKGTYLILNPPGTTAHEYGLAVDIGGLSGTLLTQDSIAEIAKNNGLSRPCGKGDPVHFSPAYLTGQGPVGCKVLQCQINSPIDVVVTDPLGRHVGINSSDGGFINEIGIGTFFSGIGTEPQRIAIQENIPGIYQISGVGTGTGPYHLLLSTNDSEGEQLASFEISGQATPGMKINPISIIVGYQFNGFFAPVANIPTVNWLQAGASVPIKFSLKGNFGLQSVLAPGYPKSQAVACNSDALTNGSESTDTAGKSGLKYDPVLDQYNYVWKTKTAWAGTCRQFVLRLSDGSYYRANFAIEK